MKAASLLMAMGLLCLLSGRTESRVAREAAIHTSHDGVNKQLAEKTPAESRASGGRTLADERFLMNLANLLSMRAYA